MVICLELESLNQVAERTNSREQASFRSQV